MKSTYLALLVALGAASCAAGPGGIGAPPSAERIVLPDGGTATIEGGRVDVYDAGSNRVGYGVERSDGSWDLFRTDGSRVGLIQPGTGGQPARLTVPK